MIQVIKGHLVMNYLWITLQNISIMKFTIALMLLGLTVLSCKKETKVDTSTTTTDSVIIDRVPADTVVTTTPVPSDTLHTADPAATKKTDTAKVIKK